MTTFWMTLWYAGAVVMTMGHEGQTLDSCLDMASTIQTDIDSAIERGDSENLTISPVSRFPTGDFKITCEKEILPIDEKYLIP